MTCENISSYFEEDVCVSYLDQFDNEYKTCGKLHEIFPDYGVVVGKYEIRFSNIKSIASLDDEVLYENPRIIKGWKNSFSR